MISLYFSRSKIFLDKISHFGRQTRRAHIQSLSVSIYFSWLHCFHFEQQFVVKFLRFLLYFIDPHAICECVCDVRVCSTADERKCRQRTKWSNCALISLYFFSAFDFVNWRRCPWKPNPHRNPNETKRCWFVQHRRRNYFFAASFEFSFSMNIILWNALRQNATHFIEKQDENGWKKGKRKFEMNFRFRTKATIEMNGKIRMPSRTKRRKLISNWNFISSPWSVANRWNSIIVVNIFH